MPELIHLDTIAFHTIVVLFMIILLISLKLDLRDLLQHKKTNPNEEFKTKKCRVLKICKNTCNGALKGGLTGLVIGGHGGAVAGACIMGIVNGMTTL